METVLTSLIVPAIIVSLGFLAVKEPRTAIIIYFLIAGFQHAKEAMRIKKEIGI